MAEFSENKIRYLEMIQGAIARMESNSFFLKGGTVTLATGILALSSVEMKGMHVFIAFMAVVVFWGLDSYYLCLQRRYRGLFDFVREECTLIDFDLNYRKADEWVTRKHRKSSFFRCLFSPAEWPFYAIVLLIVSILLSATSTKPS